MHIYVADISDLAQVAAFFMLVWAVVLYHLRRKRWFRLSSVLLTLGAVGAILMYTVVGRTPSDTHTFIFSMDFHHNEFFREMFMNALLYLPFGMALSVLIGPWAILAALVMSFSIEAWQYFAGTGTAQATDVIFNAIGAALGIIPLFAAAAAGRRFRRNQTKS